MKRVEDYPQEVQRQIWAMGWIPFTEWDEMVCNIAAERNISVVEAAIVQVQRLRTAQQWSERGVQRVK